MNLQILIRRLRGKATLVTGEGTSIAPGARILNAGRSNDCIVVGEHCRIEGELFVFAHGGRISIGDWCFVGPGTRLWSALNISIGNRVLISHNVNVMDSLTHPLDSRERHAQFRSIRLTGHPMAINLDERPVRIEDDAWVGAGAIVLRGVTIGCGAVIGAGAVVTRDVPPYTIVVGNPARVVRRLKADSIES